MDALSGVAPAITPDVLDVLPEPRETGGGTPPPVPPYLGRARGPGAPRGALGAPGPAGAGGVTTRLVLDYVERAGGRDAVRRLLGSLGLEGRETELRDENHWSSYRTKIALLEGAAAVLDDPLAARHVGAASMDFNVASGI